MKKLSIISIIFTLIIFGWGAHSLGQEPPNPRGELRIVDKHPLNWAWITMNVLEHLIEVDKDGTLIPGLATRWQWLDDRTLEMRLRQGVTFHNGERFDAEIVKLNWEDNIRLKQPHSDGVFLNFKPGSRLEIIDPYTIRFIFSKPDGGALAKLSIMHISNRQFYRELGWGEKHW
jgi:peptide/nickel transport system substrate-binding protein